jgi:hypothetical protein
MNESITRIADLPEGGGGGGGGPPPPPSFSHDGGPGNNYIPMNVHPNPYGNSNQPQVMPLPQQPMSGGGGGGGPPMNAPPMPNQLTPEQQMMLMQMQQQRLPSRDIQMNMDEYQQDEQIQPNYVPKPKLTGNYVKEYEEKHEKELEEHEKKKYREHWMDQLITEFQTPLLIALLYFIFQMPAINTLIFKKLSFLSIYKEDGNFNFQGLLLKSVLFGILFYSVIKTSNFISTM